MRLFLACCGNSLDGESSMWYMEASPSAIGHNIITSIFTFPLICSHNAASMQPNHGKGVQFSLNRNNVFLLQSNEMPSANCASVVLAVMPRSNEPVVQRWFKGSRASTTYWHPQIKFVVWLRAVVAPRNLLSDRLKHSRTSLEPRTVLLPAQRIQHWLKL